MARLQGIDDGAIDWPRVQAALNQRTGQAIEVGVIAPRDIVPDEIGAQEQEVPGR